MESCCSRTAAVAAGTAHAIATWPANCKPPGWPLSWPTCAPPGKSNSTRALAGLRFDIDLLATRVTALTDWVLDYRPTAGLPVGLFGASTGAAAALVAAAARPGSVAAVVSRGGRPDLAGPHLRAVSQPTLLIVGALDAMVIELNRKALRKLTGEARLEVIAGASHLFSEPGALEQVAQLARDWLIRHLKPASPERRSTGSTPP